MNSDANIEQAESEFECSECDFKCVNEIDIIKHSARHQQSNSSTVIGSALSFIQSKSTKEHGPNKSLKDIMKEKNIEQCISMVKKEPSAHEELSSELNNESVIGQKEIKLEQIDIKRENIPHISLGYSTNIRPEPNSFDSMVFGSDYFEIEDTSSSVNNDANTFTKYEIPRHFKAASKPFPLPYKYMIIKAITTLKEMGGSSRCSILKHILANYNFAHNVDANTKRHNNGSLTLSAGDEKKVTVRIELAIGKLLAAKEIIQVKGKFKVANVKKKLEVKQMKHNIPSPKWYLEI